MKSSLCLPWCTFQTNNNHKTINLKYTCLLFTFCSEAIKHPFFSGFDWSGGNCAHYLWILGSTTRLAGAAQPVSDSDRSAEGADASPRHAVSHPASRCAVVGCCGAKCQHPKRGNHLLVLHPGAARKHKNEESHCYGKNGNTPSLFCKQQSGCFRWRSNTGSYYCSLFTSWATQINSCIVMVRNKKPKSLLKENDLVYMLTLSFPCLFEVQ